jgi:hypothetical protein
MIITEYMAFNDHAMRLQTVTNRAKTIANQEWADRYQAGLTSSSFNISDHR